MLHSSSFESGNRLVSFSSILITNILKKMVYYASFLFGCMEQDFREINLKASRYNFFVRGVGGGSSCILIMNKGRF